MQRLSMHLIMRNIGIALERIRVRENITQREMAALLDVSLPTYSRLATGKAEDIPLSKLMPIYEKYRIPPLALTGIRDIYSDLLHAAAELSEQQQKYLLYLSNKLQKIEELNSETFVGKHVLLHIPVGEQKDGMFYQGERLEIMNIGHYATLDPKINCAFQIVSSYYQPCYYKDDILLVEETSALRDGCVTLVENTETHQFYIREYRADSIPRLCSVTGVEPDLPLFPNFSSNSTPYLCHGVVKAVAGPGFRRNFL